MFKPEFKQEAAALLRSSGRPLKQIAGELGVQPSMLRIWRRRRDGEAPRPQSVTERLQFRGSPRAPALRTAGDGQCVTRPDPLGIEHFLAAQKHRIALFVRTTSLARAQVKIGRANLAYNFSRLAWLNTRAAPA